MRSLQDSVGQLAEENSELKRRIEQFERPDLQGLATSQPMVRNDA